MTMQAVADEAKVALDTVYAAVGRKPVLVSLLIETAISGTDTAVPADEREYVKRIVAAERARDKLEIYAKASADIQVRLAPVVRAIQGAASAEPSLAKLWASIAARRARNMRKLADDLLATGELRSGTSADEVTDVLWAMGSPELFVLLVEERGWSADAYARWLADAWARLFLGRPGR